MSAMNLPLFYILVHQSVVTNENTPMLETIPFPMFLIVQLHLADHDNQP